MTDYIRMWKYVLTMCNTIQFNATQYIIDSSWGLFSDNNLNKQTNKLSKTKNKLLIKILYKSSHLSFKTKGTHSI